MTFDESVLDSQAALDRGDPAGVLRALAGAGAQVRLATGLTRQAVPAGWADGRPRAVLVVGDGDAAGVASLVVAILAEGGAVPVVRLDSGTLPAWVGALDLVVAISLAPGAGRAAGPAQEAGRRGARLVTIGPDDGALAPISRQSRGVHVPVPGQVGGIDLPRSGHALLWSLLTPALLLGRGFDLLGADHDEAALAAVADLLDARAAVCGPAAATTDNPAKSLALALDGAVPVVAAAGPLGAAAAGRAASVLARVARVPAVPVALPDGAGDVVAAFSGGLAGGPAADIFADPFEDPAGARVHVLLLDLDPDRTGTIVSDLADRRGVRVSEVPAEAETALGRFAQTSAVVDLAATYLGLAAGFDPGPSLDGSGGQLFV